LRVFKYEDSKAARYLPAEAEIKRLLLTGEKALSKIRL